MRITCERASKRAEAEAIPSLVCQTSRQAKQFTSRRFGACGCLGPCKDKTCSGAAQSARSVAYLLCHWAFERRRALGRVPRRIALCRHSIVSPLREVSKLVFVCRDSRGDDELLNANPLDFFARSVAAQPADSCGAPCVVTAPYHEEVGGLVHTRVGSGAGLGAEEQKGTWNLVANL